MRSPLGMIIENFLNPRIFMGFRLKMVPLPCRMLILAGPKPVLCRVRNIRCSIAMRVAVAKKMIKLIPRIFSHFGRNPRIRVGCKMLINMDFGQKGSETVRNWVSLRYGFRTNGHRNIFLSGNRKGARTNDNSWHETPKGLVKRCSQENTRGLRVALNSFWLGSFSRLRELNPCHWAVSVA